MFHLPALQQPAWIEDLIDTNNTIFGIEEREQAEDASNCVHDRFGMRIICFNNIELESRA